MQAMELIGQYLPQLPESNRKRVINANIAAIAGQTGVETFGIPEEVKPDGNDLSIASLENNALQQGGQVLIDPDQNHFTHLTVHMQFAGQLVKAVQEKQLDPRMGDKAMQALIPHMLTHLKYMEEDPTRKEQYEEMNQQLSELMKIADQMAKFAEQINEQEQAAQQQQAQAGQQDPKTMVAMNKIQLDRMKAANDAQIKQAKAQHQMQLQDQKTAQKLMINRVSTASKYGAIQP